jgi:hypothetical protein
MPNAEVWVDADFEAAMQRFAYKLADIKDSIYERGYKDGIAEVTKRPEFSCVTDEETMEEVEDAPSNPGFCASEPESAN